jgi:hypothetical protein
MSTEALTKAQRKYLNDTLALGSLGYSVDVLTGPESAMARRLRDRGLLSLDFIPRVRDWHWQITDAGRAALATKENSNAE